MRQLQAPIYFYCDPREGVPEGDKLQHCLICLAEGFRELGIPFFSNTNYWQESPEQEYLIRHNPNINPDDCSVVIFTNNWYTVNLPLPKNLFHPNRKYLTVYIDGEDGDRTYIDRPEFRQFDFILRNHYNKHLHYGKNFYPWPFGLTYRILQELDKVPNFQDRDRHLLINYRHWATNTHSVRQITGSQVIPSLEKILPVHHYVDNEKPTDTYHHHHWKQSGGRHYPNYYKRLKDSAACAAFGGFFVPSWFKNPGSFGSRFGKRVFTKLKLKSNTVVQWDSWRLWESLAAGCVTFHLDFEKYGFSLPTMPKNWQHYIGIDLDNIQESVDRIAAQPEILEEIATAGRRWALENYSPVPIAIAFLQTIGYSDLLSESASSYQQSLGN
ncbi:glycosyltransferase [Scytonema sp. NUACC26]|uniref:glycosyltransferase n=1 Tax=Scytonema sp. NUACC26 TaxID=3140176 RepID=UPI0034DBEDA3